jgi:hypothetical protein
VFDIKSYKDLMVWKKSIELVISTYEIARMFPKEEMYALSSQIRRAAVSVPSNIAEGHDRNSDKETIDDVLEKCYEIGKMLNALIKKIKSE